MPKLSTTAIALAAALFAAVLPATAQQASTVSGQARGTEEPLDEEYTALIREATTESFFSTPLVDHLPFSETVPTPLEHHGYIAGAPDVLSYPEEVYSYMRALAAASPRVDVFTIGESEEGREMILVVVGSEESIAGLEANKAALRALADPRITTPDAGRGDHRLRQARLLVRGRHPFAGDGVAGDVHGAGLPARRGRERLHPRDP